MIEHVCTACGVVFLAKKSERRRYCSLNCYWQAKQTTQSRQCDYCGATYLPRAERSVKGYCTYECSVKHQREQRPVHKATCEHCGKQFTLRYKGQNKKFCSQYCGNTNRRSANYGIGIWRANNFSQERKQAIRERDNFRCVICGSEDRIQVDHIIAVRLGGTNDPSNGQTLCHACHVEKTNHDKVLIRQRRRTPVQLSLPLDFD